jgi:hypothetical protein
MQQMSGGSWGKGTEQFSTDRFSNAENLGMNGTAAAAIAAAAQAAGGRLGDVAGQELFKRFLENARSNAGNEDVKAFPDSMMGHRGSGVPASPSPSNAMMSGGNGYRPPGFDVNRSVTPVSVARNSGLPQQSALLGMMSNSNSANNQSQLNPAGAASSGKYYNPSQMRMMGWG